MRRVVVTGIGLVTPLGCNVEYSWKKLVSGESGIRKIKGFDTQDLSVKIGGEIIKGTNEGELNTDAWIPLKEQRKMGEFIHYGIIAGIEAIEDSGWKPEKERELMRTGVMIGSGIGGLSLIQETSLEIKEKGAKRVSPFFIPASLINLTAGHLSIKYGFRGPNHSVTTACATGGHAISDAARIIACDEADVILAGSTESAVCNIGVAGFAAARALSSSFNDTPEKASRPWDKARDGFVMGDGAGIVILEELEHAKKRGAKIYAEVIGYGLSGDAYHVTAPHPEGRGGYDAMSSAFNKAKISPDQVDYINAHGTSTPLGDIIELQAIKRYFGSAAYKLSMSSTKSSIGHLLGAAGSVEAIFCLLAMRDNIIPPTLNLDNPDEGCDIDLVPHKAKERNVNIALSNSFGFGGTNISLLFKKL